MLQAQKSQETLKQQSEAASSKDEKKVEKKNEAEPPKQEAKTARISRSEGSPPPRDVTWHRDCALQAKWRG